LEILLERARAVFAAGRVGFSYLEVQRAEQNLLFAENAVLEAQESYLNALDRFKIVLGMPVTDELDVVAVELDVNVPELEGVDVLEVAERYRLDLQTARDVTEDARRAVDNAQNGLLPELNLTGRTQLANRNETPARTLDSRTLEYAAGVTLDLPVDRLAERNAYRRALIQLDQANRRFDDIRAQVQADVRESQRAIRTAKSSLEISRVNITLAERRLDLANELLRQGTQNTRDVVEAQDDLLQALDDYERAQAGFQVEILRYLRNTGTLRVDPAAGSIGRAMRREEQAPLVGTTSAAVDG
jgi:outer membrane protein TolC